MSDLPDPHDREHEHAPPSEIDLLRWSEALSAIAKTGLGFSDNLYERERFEEVLAVAADIRVTSGHAFDTDTVVSEWMKQVGNGVPGYVTPKVAVGAVVGDEEGRILLIQRSDSGIWLYPTGWCDVGYSAAEVVIKEVWEETGIQAEVIAPIAIFDGLRLGFTGVPLYSLVFACRPIGGELNPHPLECRDAGWFAQDELPAPMAGADLWIDHAFRAIRGEQVPVWFDPPRRRPWREDEGE
jgi:8-oxo-dGTP pyrophosphatase MutT (NUDIX family)